METKLVSIGDGFFLFEVDAHRSLSHAKQFVEGALKDNARLAELKDYFVMEEKIRVKQKNGIVILGSEIRVKQGIGYLVFSKDNYPHAEYEKAVQNGWSRYVLVAESSPGSLSG